MRNGPDEAGDAGDGVSAAEAIVMAVSVLFTVSLFAFAAWHAAAVQPPSRPVAEAVDRQVAPDGEVVYDVELRNPGGSGLVDVTVEVACAEQTIELTFENVPAEGRRKGTVACSPGTVDPDVTVVSWITE